MRSISSCGRPRQGVLPCAARSMRVVYDTSIPVSFSPLIGKSETILVYPRPHQQHWWHLSCCTCSQGYMVYLRRAPISVRHLRSGGGNQHLFFTKSLSTLCPLASHPFNHSILNILMGHAFAPHLWLLATLLPDLTPFPFQACKVFRILGHP